MKFNFQKVAAIGASVLLTGMTMGMAAAANFPLPYSSGASSGVAVVSGSGAGVDDLTARSSIANYLAGQVTTTGDVVTGDESYTIEGSGTALYLEGVFTETLDDGDFTIFADETYSESLGNNDHDIEYTQQLTIDPDGLISTSYQTNTEDDDSTADILTSIPDSTNVYTYRIDFKSAVTVDTTSATTAAADIETSTLVIMGKTYTISNIDLVAVEGLIDKLTLLSGASTASIDDEESATLTVEGTSYTVTANIYADDSVKLTVGSETTDKMTAGDTFKLSDGTRVGIKEVFYSTKETKTSSVEIYMGANEVLLEKDDEVEINSVDIDDSLVTFTQTDGGAYVELNAIEITVKTEEDFFLEDGDSWTDPVFGAFALNMEALDEDETVNVVDISTSSSSGEIEFVTSAGDIIELPLARNISLNEAYLGKETNPDTSSFLDVDETMTTMDNDSATTDTSDHYFIVTTNNDGSRAHLFKIDKIVSGGTAGTDDTVYIKDITGDVEDEVAIKIGEADTGDTDGFGDWNFQLTTGGAGTPVLDVGEGAGNGEIIATVADAVTSAKMIKLKNGATMGLTTGANPTVIISEDGTRSSTNDIAAVITYDNVTENEIIVATATIDASGNSLIAHDDDSKSYTAYTDWGAKLEWNSDNFELTITSPEDQTEVVFNVIAGDITTTTTVAGTMVFTDAEETSWATRDVILVGGSCINSATAEVLGLTYPTCESAWTTATGAGSGKYIIQSVGDVFTTGKIALVVAGYTKADTAAAATRLVNQPTTIDTTAGNKYVGIVGVTGSSTITKVA